MADEDRAFVAEIPPKFTPSLFGPRSDRLGSAGWTSDGFGGRGLPALHVLEAQGVADPPAAAIEERFGVAAITGNGAVAAAVTAGKQAAAVLTGGGTLTATGAKGARITASSVGGGTLTASTLKNARVVLTLSGGGTLTATGTSGAPLVATGGGVWLRPQPQQLLEDIQHAEGRARISGGGRLHARGIGLEHDLDAELAELLALALV